MHKLTTLSNGVRLILTPMKGTKTITVFVFVACGSRYETKNINGISHFIEHMVFKGTKKYPKSLDIAKTLEGVGADFNAFTGKELTAFYVRLPEKHFPVALDVLSDFLKYPLFPESEIEKEKKVILEEIKMREDLPRILAAEGIERLLFKDSPLGMDIAGKKKSVGKINREEIIQFVKKYYHPKTIVVSIAGKIEDKNVKTIKDYFLINKGGEKKGYRKAKEIFRPEIEIINKKTEQSHINLGVYGYRTGHKDRYAYKLIGEILGGSMSSRLFEEVREKRGLAYYISSASESLLDTGYLSVSAGVAHERTDEALEVITLELKKLRQKKIDKNELKRHKERIKGGLILDFEESNEVAYFYGQQEVLEKEIEEFEEILKKIDEVDAESIKKVARDIFQTKKMKLAIVGPERDKRKYLSILKV